MTVSFIIPAYNCEKYIEKCIDSVLCQTGAALDVIVINDGSTDRTEEILEKYKEKIRVKTTPNRGGSAARNEGIKMMSGDYTVFLDADDFLVDGALERLISVLAETDADIIKYRYKTVFPDGREQCPPNQFNKYDIIEKKDFKKDIYPYFMSGIRLNSMCVGIYRSSLIAGKAFREDMRVAEDAMFALDVYTDAERIAFIPDILYGYYQSGEGLTGSGAAVLYKYRCNFRFAKKTAGMLKRWGMRTPLNVIKVYLRPFVLTFDKLIRVIRGKFGNGGEDIAGNEK